MEANLTKEEKLEQLERLLQSRALHGSESLKAFLRFVSLKAIEDPDSYLKEYIIATEVFGRNSNYNSRSDSAVRVQAGRLRAKLQEYYTTEGKDDKVLIDLPKGHYTPVFSYIEPVNGGVASGGPAAEAEPRAIESKPARGEWLKIAVIGLAVITLALGLLALNYRLEMSRLKDSGDAKASASSEFEAISPLWGDFLQSREPVLVAFSNTLFQGTAETGMKLLKPFNSPASSFSSSTAPQSSSVAKEDANVVTEHYTGVGEVMGVYCLSDFFSRAGRSIRVKRSLLLTWDDLKSDNIVFLGSPAENLLLRDLPQEQDFLFRNLTEDKEAIGFGIVNTKPKAGEQTIYMAKQEGPSRSQISEDYALISMLRGLDPRHRLLILAGITTFGTQAAAEYVTKPEYVKDLIARLDASEDGQTSRLPAFYQILIKVKVNGGVPVQISYVTHHAL